MKKFIRKIVLFALLIGAILILLEVSVRSVPNEYSYKYEYLEKNITEIKVLSLGSSAARSGIDPDVFPISAFNVAQVSQDLETDCAIIHKYIESADSLKYVFFPILPMAYSYRMGEGVEDWRLRKYPIYMNLDVEKPAFSDRFELSNFPGSVGQIIKYLKGEKTVDCYKKGMGDDDVVENEEKKISQGVMIAGIHNEHFYRENYEIIVPVLENTIELCAKHDVKIVLIVLPCYYTYCENIEPLMVSECDSISRKIVDNHSNVTYFNWFTDSTFVSEDFRNSNHLSQAGAKKLTNRIIQLLGL